MNIQEKMNLFHKNSIKMMIESLKSKSIDIIHDEENLSIRFINMRDKESFLISEIEKEDFQSNDKDLLDNDFDLFQSYYLYTESKKIYENNDIIIKYIL